MRTLLTALALALVLVASQAFAGTTVFGAKAGLNIANLHGDDVEDSDSRMGACLGGFLEIPINDMIGFQPEILYTMKGASWDAGDDGDDYEVTFKVSYIEIPMLFKVNVPMASSVKPFLVVGPEVAFKTSAKFEVSAEDASAEWDADNIKGTDMGLIIGGGIGFPMMQRMAMLEARYDLGLTTIDDSDEEADVKNNAISIIVGITF